MTNKIKPKILMVYIEPTPYILGLIEHLMAICPEQIDVLFLNENLSQNWNIPLPKKYKLLSKISGNKFFYIFNLFLKNRYDLVHLAGWGHSLLLLFVFIATMFRTPIAMESDTPIPHHTQKWKRIVKKFFYPPLFSLIGVFLPGGTRQAKYFEYYGVKQEKIIPANMTVDIAAIKKYAANLDSIDRQRIRDQYGIKENDLVFLFVGRLVENKGIVDLITAFNKIQHEKAVLLIVGDGILRSQVEDFSKINLKIRYAGRLIENSLIEAYYIADVFVLPSRFEPWGLVINEAMALSRPVIVSDRVGCIDDLVCDKETGLVIKAECVLQLQAAMEYMINEPLKRAIMEKNTAKKIAEWTLENEAKLVCKAWNQLLASKDLLLQNI